MPDDEEQDQNPIPQSRRQKGSQSVSQGWNRAKVQDLIDYYENQSDEEAIAEAEAAYRKPKTTIMQIPNDLVPHVQRLIARRAS